MKIYIGSDHGGVELKNQLVAELSKKYDVEESTVKYDPLDDYPDFAFDCGSKMDKTNDYMILICTNGVGIAIAANKIKGVRCGRVCSLDDVSAAKAHNHVNSISMPASTPISDALEYVETLINTPYDMNERHVRRVNKIIAYENGTYNEL